MAVWPKALFARAPAAGHGARSARYRRTIATAVGRFSRWSALTMDTAISHLFARPLKAESNFHPVRHQQTVPAVHVFRLSGAEGIRSTWFVGRFDEVDPHDVAAEVIGFAELVVGRRSADRSAQPYLHRSAWPVAAKTQRDFPGTIRSASAPGRGLDRRAQLRPRAGHLRDEEVRQVLLLSHQRPETGPSHRRSAGGRFPVWTAAKGGPWSRSPRWCTSLPSR